MEIQAILERAVRNCPWSGDLWSFYLRHTAQSSSYTVDTLIEIKDRAISIPWLTAQETEMVKVYFTWISLCRLRVSDWEEQIEEMTFLEDQLDECLERIEGTSPKSKRCSACFGFGLGLMVGFEYPEGYLLGKLAVEIKTLSNDADQARALWVSMLKANALRTEYWQDRIQWERYPPSRKRH